MFAAYQFKSSFAQTIVSATDIKLTLFSSCGIKGSMGRRRLEVWELLVELLRDAVIFEQRRKLATVKDFKTESTVRVQKFFTGALDVKARVS